MGRTSYIRKAIIGPGCFNRLETEIEMAVSKAY